VKLAYILQRIVQAAVILFVIITLNFCLVRGMPGDPMLNILGESDYHLLLANAPDTLEELRAYYGLEKSLLDQYWTYLKDTSRLNFGYSFHVAQRCPDHSDNDRADNPDNQGDTRSVDQFTENILTYIVGAQPMRFTGAKIRRAEGIGIIGCNLRRKDGKHSANNQNTHAKADKLIFRKKPTHALPIL
jgi:hypothetical protein